MPEDRSLDEFAGEESGDAEEPATGEGPKESGDGQVVDENGPENAERPDDDSSDDPATSTSAWTAAGAGCQRCGTRISRRWRDDGDLVCAECKTW